MANKLSDPETYPSQVGKYFRWYAIGLWWGPKKRPEIGKSIRNGLRRPEADLFPKRRSHNQCLAFLEWNLTSMEIIPLPRPRAVSGSCDGQFDILISPVILLGYVVLSKNRRRMFLLNFFFFLNCWWWHTTALSVWSCQLLPSPCSCPALYQCRVRPQFTHFYTCHLWRARDF